MYSITQVSKIINVHAQTLRNWERSGLLEPQRIGHLRIFSDKDILRCEIIKRYSRRGFNMNRIRQLLLLEETNHLNLATKGDIHEA